MKKHTIQRYLILLAAVLAITCNSDEETKPILDTDRDGIADLEDQCPNTREGETVNEFGCSSSEIDDFDGDGIPNNLDECPRTPSSLEEELAVDANGCLQNRVWLESGAIIAEEIPNQIVLSGFSDMKPEDIAALIVSLEVDIDAIESCSCDKDIQLWPLPNGLDLDNAIAEAESTPGKELSGDKNFLIGIVDEPSNYGSFPDETFNPIFNDDPNKPVVAILDSGLDLAQLNFEGLQLLDTQTINQNIGCDVPSGTVSGFGWNFADGNADMKEDNVGHGTNVTKTFVKNLANTDLSEFQILPLKLFDGANDGSYWDVVCAFSYLNKLDSLGYDIALVNTSFGGELESLRANEGNIKKDLLVLKQLVDSLNETVVVSSAGNNRSDNDDMPYFPASYTSSRWFDNPSSNLVAVAGHDYKRPEVFRNDTTGSGSNYGMETVDLAAPWHFTIHENGMDAFGNPIAGLELFGTSFSAPNVSALLLEHYFEKGLKGEQLKLDFLNNSNYIKTNTSLNNLVKNNRYVD